MTCLLAGDQAHPSLRPQTYIHVCKSVAATDKSGGGWGEGEGVGGHARQETVRDERELLVFNDQPTGTLILKVKTSGKTGQLVFVGTCVWHIRLN